MNYHAGPRKVYRAKEPNQAKIFLFGYRSLLNQQETLTDVLDEYRDRSTRATSCPEAIRAADEIGEKLRGILEAINSLTDERHKEILTMRYVAGYDWERIFVKTSYEKTRAYELHRGALELVDAFLAGEGRG